MINLAEVEYLNSCFTQEKPKAPTSEKLVSDFAEALGEVFEGFVLTIVDNNGDQYTASNVDPVSALKMIDSALDVLKDGF